MTDFPGYRQPSPDMVKAVTEMKQTEERVLRYIEGLDVDLDPRWRSIAITHYQEGTMALIRAVLRPARLSLPEDEVPAPVIPAEDFSETAPSSNQMS